jgi:hypothetical protein
MSKFLHMLTQAEEYNHYLIGDRVWRGWDLSCGDYVIAEVDGVRLTVQMGYGGKGYRWQYSRGLSDKVSFRHEGAAETLEDACCAALSFVPEHQVFEYFGQTYDCYGSRCHNGGIRWTFVVDGDEVEVIGPIDFHDGDRYKWRRPWSPAENLLKTYCNTAGGLEGRCQTLLEAMVAAVNAPEGFKRSCAELIATLFPGKQ